MYPMWTNLYWGLRSTGFKGNQNHQRSSQAFIDIIDKHRGFDGGDES